MMKQLTLAAYCLMYLCQADAAQVATSLDGATSRGQMTHSRRLQEHQRKLSRPMRRRVKKEKSSAPSQTPTMSQQPSATPTARPSSTPSAQPSQEPTASMQPSATPTISMAPSSEPSATPSLLPTSSPSDYPSLTPSARPSMYPTSSPSYTPSMIPSTTPSNVPTKQPSFAPSGYPTWSPSMVPTKTPSVSPTLAPSISSAPTGTLSPTVDPMGFDTTLTSEQETVQLCRREPPAGFEALAVYSISYTFDLVVAKEADVSVAMVEGEKLVGEQTAQIFCGLDTDETFYLQQISSLDPDTIVGSCGTTSTTDCHVIVGSFTASLYVPDSPNLRQLAPAAPTDIQARFQTVLDTILPNVVQELEISSRSSSASAVSDLAPKPLNKSTSNSVVGPVVGCLVALCVVALVVVVVVMRRRAKNAKMEFYQDNLDFVDMSMDNDTEAQGETPSSTPVRQAFVINEEESVSGESIFEGLGAGTMKRPEEEGVRFVQTGAMKATLRELGPRPYPTSPISNHSPMMDTVDL